MSKIVAEIGQNHCGDMSLAKRLIRLAQENGADLVKFQLYDHKALYKDNPQIPNVELSLDQAQYLFQFGALLGIEVFFSVFDVKRVDWCEAIGVKRYKIAATMRDKRVIDAVNQTMKPQVVSFNVTYYHCYDYWPPRNYFKTTRLFCPEGYPAKLVYIPDFCEEPDYQGFSDHTIGIDAAKIALSRGAKVIEKHFAIDHETGIDAKWSMTPSELKELKRFSDIVQQVI